LTHGAGQWTWPLVADAFRRGHDTRVGFESVHLPGGAHARSNAELVRAAVALRADPAWPAVPFFDLEVAVGFCIDYSQYSRMLYGGFPPWQYQPPSALP
jgi:hypothetical protein